MPVARAEDGMSGLPDYHELDVQHLKANIEHGPTEQGTQNQIAASTDILDPDRLGRDEVAELIALNYRHELHLEDHNEGTNTTPGAVQARQILGINVDRSDSVLFVEATGEMDESTFLEGAGNIEDLETDIAVSPGNLVESKLTVNPAFNDTTNGTGGGGTTAHYEQFINFREFVETGPVVDANDNLDVVQRLQHDEVGGQSSTFLYATMYWVTHEIEDSRPQFGL